MTDSNKLTIKQKVFAIFQQSKMFVMFVLGYSSGLPLMLTASSLFLWYKDNGIEIKDIGFLSLIAVPYGFKYLWAPILDKVTIKGFTRRKGWMLLTQVLIIFSIILMSQFSPDQSPLIIAFIGFAICFFSATQDIAINAYQTEVLDEKERALGAAVAVLGYRIGMLVTGALVLIIVQKLDNNWNLGLLTIVPFFMIAPVVTLFIKESEVEVKPKTFNEAFTLPFIEFFQRKGVLTALVILGILIVYKLADAMAFSLNTVFFADLGFDKVTIAVSYKTVSLVFTILGLLFGGFVAKKIGVFKSFLYFSFIMAFANLSYALLAVVGKNHTLMVVSVAVEYFCGAMGTAILVAMIMSLVNVSFSATQFAILSSIDSLGRVFVGPVAGDVQQSYGWVNLFLFSFMVGIVTSIVIYIFRKRIKEMANLD